jgi:coproporphyrinogen III oxidase-like Fe-S oxidoreductase
MKWIGIGPGAHGRLTNMNTNQRIRTFGVIIISIDDDLLIFFFVI